MHFILNDPARDAFKGMSFGETSSREMSFGGTSFRKVTSYIKRTSVGETRQARTRLQAIQQEREKEKARAVAEESSARLGLDGGMLTQVLRI